MEIKKSKQYGQYFTPIEIARFMVNLISKKKQARILEPCAGKGIFLKTLSEAEYLNIEAYEIDETLSNESPIKIEYRDFLQTPITDKFDLIIGNPPYVRWKNIPEQIREKLKTNPLWANRINGLNDLLYLFIIHSIDKLNVGGELIFITPNFWTTTLHSKTVREKIIREGRIELMINFDETKVFDGVNSNILIFKFVKDKQAKEMKLLNLNPQKDLTEAINMIKEIIKTLNCEKEVSNGTFWAYTHRQFNSKEPWRPLPPSIEPQILKIEKNADTKLGYLMDIGNGMVSGLDEAFKLEESNLLTKDENKKLIKVAKAKDLVKYFNKSYSKYIYVNDIQKEEELQKFQNIYTQLFKYKPELEKRYNYGKNIPWWHWVFLRNKKLIEKSPKIVVPCKERFNVKKFVRFSLISGNFYVTQDATALVKKPEIQENIRYFLAVLNSDLIFQWLKYRGLKRGGVLEFSEKPLSEIPIKRINWLDKEEVKVHNEIVNIINKILEEQNFKLYKEQIEELIKKIYKVN